jgi:hypothetical protein
MARIIPFTIPDGYKQKPSLTQKEGKLIEFRLPVEKKLA